MAYKVKGHVSNLNNGCMQSMGELNFIYKILIKGFRDMLVLFCFVFLIVDAGVPMYQLPM